MHRSGHGPHAGWREGSRGAGTRASSGAGSRSGPAGCPHCSGCRLSFNTGRIRPPAHPPGHPAPEWVELDSPSLLSLCVPTRALAVSLTILAEVHWSVPPVGVADCHGRNAARPRVREPHQGDGATPGFVRRVQSGRDPWACPRGSRRLRGSRYTVPHRGRDPQGRPGTRARASETVVIFPRRGPRGCQGHILAALENLVVRTRRARRVLEGRTSFTPSCSGVATSEGRADRHRSGEFAALVSCAHRGRCMGEVVSILRENMNAKKCAFKVPCEM